MSEEEKELIRASAKVVSAFIKSDDRPAHRGANAAFEECCQYLENKMKIANIRQRGLMK